MSTLELFLSKSHKFDLENPVSVTYTADSITVTRRQYKCTTCGGTLSLDYDQMLDLPSEMRKGCKKV